MGSCHGNETPSNFASHILDICQSCQSTWRINTVHSLVNITIQALHWHKHHRTALIYNLRVVWLVIYAQLTSRANIHTDKLPPTQGQKFYCSPHQTNRIQFNSKQFSRKTERASTYCMRSCMDIQKMPSSAPSGLSSSLTARGSMFQQSDLSDHSPIHDTLPHGFRSRTSLIENIKFNTVKMLFTCLHQHHHQTEKILSHLCPLTSLTSSTE